jgi:CheY-like chemotaxis protein
MSSAALLLLADADSRQPYDDWRAGPSPDPLRPEAYGQRRVLVVDDEPIVLSFVARLLEEAGYRVDTASSGIEALRLVQGGLQPDLVITDIRMPVLDGWEMGRALTLRRPGLPILYVSGYDLEAGAPARGSFLRKPFDPDELLRRVDRLLEGR